MIWKLNLKPSEWGASLIFPLRAGPGDIYLASDPAELPDELLDEVMYVIQRAARPVEFLTFKPAEVLVWMRSSPTRWELAQRLTEIRWTLAISSAWQVDSLVPIALRWPVAKRCIQSMDRLNLSRWMPHSYSTVGHSGVCEDCGSGRAESLMHKQDARPSFWRIDDESGEDQSNYYAMLSAGQTG